MINHHLILSVTFATLVTLTSVTFAQQSRHIHLNGKHLSIQQIIALDRQVGTFVPNGAYWLDRRTGYWGYEGNPTPQGRITSRNANTPRGPAYNSAPGYNRSGPFGDSMSDGNCSFVNGVPVGNC